MVQVPNTAAADARADRVSVFISYAREDLSFARRIEEALLLNNVEVRADWQLERGEAFDEQLRLFIRDSDAFLFIATPDSASSPNCRSEIDLAVAMNKPILPVIRVAVDESLLHAAIRKPQWTFMRVEDDFVYEVQQLTGALKTDFELLPEHRRLLAAAEEWERSGRRRSYLLTRDGLTKARAWLERTSQRPERLPQPTALQSEYIVASQRRQTRTLRRLIVGLAASIVVLASLAAFAFYQRGVARKQTELAHTRRLEAERNLASAYVREARLRRGESDLSSAALLAARAVELDDNFLTRAELDLALQEAPPLLLARRDLAPPIVWSPQDTTIVAGMRGQPARASLITTSGSKNVTTLPLRARLTAAAWTQDGVITGDATGWMTAWSAAGAKLREARIASRPIGAIGISHDGELLAAVAGNRVVILDRELTQTAEFSCNGAEQPFTAWSPRQRILAVLSGNGLLQFWDSTSRRARIVDGRFEGNENPSWAMNFLLRWAPDGSRLLSNGGVVRLQVWYPDGRKAPALEIPQQLRQIPAMEPRPTAITWSPDGSRIAGGGQLWTADGRYAGPLIPGVGVPAWSAANGLLAIIGNDSRIRIWREERVPSEANADKEDRGRRWKQVSVLRTPRDGEASWSSDGSRIAFAGDAGVFVWDTSVIETRTTLREAREVTLLDYVSPDRRKIAFARTSILGNRAGTTLAVYDVPTDDLALVVSATMLHEIAETAWAPDSRRLATGGADRTVRVWSADSRKRQLLGEHEDVVSALQWSPDGQRLASAGWDGTVRIWDPHGGAKPAICRHAEPVSVVAWAPDGQILASAASSGIDRAPRFTTFGSIASGKHESAKPQPIRFWRRDGTFLMDITTNRHNNEVLSWSPDGSLFAAPFDRDSVRIWDRAGQIKATLRTDIGMFETIVWSSDGGRLAIAGDSNIVWIYSRDGRLISKAEHSAEAKYVRLATWNPADHRILATYGKDYAVRVWYADSGAEASVVSQNVPVRDLWWSDDGRRLAAIGHWEGVLQTWGDSNEPRAEVVRQISQRVGLQLHGFETRPLL